MKKILLIIPLSTLDWGSKNSGGVDSVCQMLVKKLSESTNSEYQYRVLAFDPFSESAHCGEIIKLSNNVEVVFFHLNEKRWGIRLPSFISNTLRILPEVKRFRPDVVHAHIANWLIAIPSKFERIATLHAYKKIGRKPVSWANDLLYTNILPIISNLFTDQYSCVGRVIEKALAQDTSKPIMIIGNPISDVFFATTPETSEANKTKPLRLITCALINRKKRIDRAIYLTHLLHESKIQSELVVIGPNVDSDYFTELQNQVKQFKLEKSIHFLGALKQNEIVSQYANSDIGVFLSEEETFGLAPLEMLACGLPLFTTDVGILSESREAFESIGVNYWDNLDDQQQIDAVLKLSKADTETSMSYVKELFLVENILKSYEKLYQDI